MNPIARRRSFGRMLRSRMALNRSRADHGVARSRRTRILHLLLLLSVIGQLASSEFMERPFPGEPPSLLFGLHEYVGLASLSFVLVFWLWVVVRHGETRFGRLLPWFRPAGIRAVMGDALAQFRAILCADPFAPTDGSFASAVHGLGLLTLTAMAATGTVYFMASGSVLAHDALSLHRVIANLKWIYLFGHAGIAVLHHLLGDDILRRMFRIGRRAGGQHLAANAGEQAPR